MKLLLFIMYSLLQQHPDYYYVVNVQGPVKMQGSNHLLVMGDSVDINASFVFRSPRDKFIVFHPQKGRYDVTPRKRQANSRPSEILALLKDNLLPSSETAVFGTRSGMIGSPEDLGDYFRQYTKRLVIGTELLPLDPSGFPDPPSRYLFVRYTYKGTIVNKQLDFVFPKKSVDSLYLRLDGQLFKKGGIDIHPQEVADMQLMYYNSKTELSVPLASVQLVVVPEKQVLAEMKLVRRLSAQRHAGEQDSETHVFEEVYSHLVNSYGTPDLSVLSTLYRRMK